MVRSMGDELSSKDPASPAGTEKKPLPPRRPIFIVRWVRRIWRFGLASFALAMVSLIVAVTTPLTDRMYNSLMVTHDPHGEKFDYIVCLGGRYERLLWTARAYSEHRAPKVIVSNAEGAAEFMRDLLVHAGVPKGDIIVDNHSHTTFEHPIGLARVRGLDPAKQRFLLITDHEHSRRVAAVFHKAGWSNFVIHGGPRPIMTDEGGLGPIKWRVQMLPRILYEYAAFVQYWWQGKI